MVTTFPADPRRLLQLLSGSILEVLDQRLIGLYVYGSLVTGGYDDGVSDVDLLAITTEDLDDSALERLRRMHADIERTYPQWRNRVEVAYLSTEGLRLFKTVTSPMINISPGEPIHRIHAGIDWLTNWYLVRTTGVTLAGRPPEKLVPNISDAEFVIAVGALAEDPNAWTSRVSERKSQSYAILTMCRALHTVETGVHHSKQESARWTRDRYPEWSALIEMALERRREPDYAPRYPVHPDGPALIAVLRDAILRKL